MKYFTIFPKYRYKQKIVRGEMRKKAALHSRRSLVLWGISQPSYFK